MFLLGHGADPALTLVNEPLRLAARVQRRVQHVLLEVGNSGCAARRC